MSGRAVAISGPPGAGKTTLAKALAEAAGGRFVGYDSHETFTRTSPRAVAEWIARGAPYGEVAAPGLVAAIGEITGAGGLAVVDTPFGRAHPETRGIFALAVWIDCPADLALARKIAQLAAGVPQGQEEAFRGWLRGYLAAYPEVVRPAIATQLERVAPLADLRLDADLSVAAAVARMRAALDAA